MYCAKCGKEISDDAKFCKYCGAGVKKITPQQPLIQEEVKPVSLEEVQPKKSKTGIVIGIVALVLLVGAVAYFLFFQKIKIDVSQYYNARVNGVNGQGTLEAEIDEDGIADAIGEVSSDEVKIEKFIDSIEINVDPKEGLSNDDHVNVAISYDSDMASELNIRFINTKQTLTVSGLTDGEEIDAFENIEIEYDGYSPDLMILSITNASYPELTFEADPSEGIENGDTITITCTNDTDALAEKGYVLSEASTQIVVEDQATAFNKISQLSQSSQDILINTAKTALDAHTPWGEYRSYSAANYEGMIVACNDSTTDVYVIFSRTITYNKTGKQINSYGVVKCSEVDTNDVNFDASVVEHDFYDSNWITNPDGFKSLESAVQTIQSQAYISYDASSGIEIDE